MMGEEIWYSLASDSRTRHIFGGIFPRDKLPKRRNITRRPRLYVVNTDVSTGRGEHWVCIYLHPTGIAEYFDSYGFPPREREIVSFLRRNSLRYVYNNYVLQGALSQNCGYYCIHYAKRKARGQSMRLILSKFRPNRPHFNDRLVMRSY